MSILELVAKERGRQEALYSSGALLWIASVPECPDSLRLAALVEEVGEVARALHEGEQENLRAELVQVAAVAVAWLEGIATARGEPVVIHGQESLL